LDPREVIADRPDTPAAPAARADLAEIVFVAPDTTEHFTPAASGSARHLRAALAADLALTVADLLELVAEACKVRVVGEVRPDRFLILEPLVADPLRLAELP